LTLSSPTSVDPTQAVHMSVPDQRTPPDHPPGGSEPRPADPPSRHITPEPDYLSEATYAATRRPVEQAATLLPHAYRSQSFYELERQQVFARSWVAVTLAEKVAQPGQVVTASVAGMPIIVTRDGEGELRAFHNVCRHRGTQLVTGDCALRRFRCPYHSWTYALDGRLLGSPLFEGSDIPADQQALFDTSHRRGFDKRDYGLLPVRVAAWGHILFVNLSEASPPLDEWLGDLPDRLAGYRLGESVAVGELTYDVRANWKLIAENFMEYYHLPWVHPELAKVSRVDDHHRFQGPGMYTGTCTTPISQDPSTSGWLSLPSTPGLNDDDAISGRFLWVTPNLAISVLPTHTFTIIVTPDGPDRTREQAVLNVHRDIAADTDASALADLTRFWDHLNREDIEIVERGQLGVSSDAFPGGPMCYRFEEPLHRFQNMVIDRMVGIDRIPEGDPRGDTSIVTASSPATGSTQTEPDPSVGVRA
jgi:choline monooxygenase